jgi:hypothetical protein
MIDHILQLLKKWWFWVCVLCVCSIPKYQHMGATGDYYTAGVPFPSLFVKHGHMGDGGRLSQGVLYIPDGSPPVGGYRVGWFIQADLICIALNAALLLLVVYGLSTLWQRINHARQSG